MDLITAGLIESKSAQYMSLLTNKDDIRKELGLPKSYEIENEVNSLRFSEQGIVFIAVSVTEGK